MPAIHYLAELDRVNVRKTLYPIVQDMDEQELRVVLLYVLHGVDVYDAIDSARGYSRKETEQQGIECCNSIATIGKRQQR